MTSLVDCPRLTSRSYKAPIDKHLTSKFKDSYLKLCSKVQQKGILNFVKVFIIIIFICQAYSLTTIPLQSSFINLSKYSRVSIYERSMGCVINQLTLNILILQCIFQFEEGCHPVVAPVVDLLLGVLAHPGAGPVL